MKILIAQDRLRSGGTERQSVLLANAFAAAGHQTTLLTFRPSGELSTTVAANVTHEVLQPLDTGFDWFAPKLYQRITTIAPDIVLCMGRMANCYAGGLQERFPSVAVIATMRTGKKLPRLFRRSIGIVRHIVANSHEARANLVAHYDAAPERVSVIHNSLVFFETQPDGTRETVRDEIGTPAPTIVLLCVAMFRPEKNQRELIEIVAGLPDDFEWQLWLVGDGPARDLCEKLVQGKPFANRVKFLGWRADPAPLYTAADIAVHASSSEALSNFLIEAQAQGLPVVAYDTQGISECFVPGNTGFMIKRGERDAFRAKIVELGNAPTSDRAMLAWQACDFAMSSFDHDRQVTRYLDLFKQLRSGKT
jgi:glycosyltransferase involved in cell wall biosynthesis